MGLQRHQNFRRCQWVGLRRLVQLFLPRSSQNFQMVLRLFPRSNQNFQTCTQAELQRLVPRLLPRSNQNFQMGTLVGIQRLVHRLLPRSYQNFQTCLMVVLQWLVQRLHPLGLLWMAKGPTYLLIEMTGTGITRWMGAALLWRPGTLLSLGPIKLSRLVHWWTYSGWYTIIATCSSALV